MGKIIYGVALGFTVLFTSCEKDLLDTTPPTQVLTNSMWLTENLTDQGVNGVYQNLRRGQMLYTFDAYVTLQGRDNSALMNGTANTSAGMFGVTWGMLDEGVHRANTAIYGITEISPVDGEKKARLV